MSHSRIHWDGTHTAHIVNTFFILLSHWVMKSFRERFCEENRCDAQRYVGKVFWRCLHRHALLLVPLLGGPRSGYFAPDMELIAGVGRALSMKQVADEVQHFAMAPGNRGWLRRKANVRVSGKKLMLLAGKYFRSTGSGQPFKLKSP